MLVCASTRQVTIDLSKHIARLGDDIAFNARGNPCDIDRIPVNHDTAQTLVRIDAGNCTHIVTPCELKIFLKPGLRLLPSLFGFGSAETGSVVGMERVGRFGIHDKARCLGCC